jgi:hypothetical protein
MPDPSSMSAPPLLNMPAAWPSVTWQPRRDTAACSRAAGLPDSKSRGMRHLPVEVWRRPWNRAASATGRIGRSGQQPC